MTDLGVSDGSAGGGGGGGAAGSWPQELDTEYECLGELGRGGMAVVYRARERALGRDVAIKVVRPRFTSDEESVKRLAREARTVAQLEHPNIVSLHAVKPLERSGGLALVMQIVPGRTLKAALATAPLTPEHTEHVLRDIARALAYAHRCGVVHRDVKPENIFLDDITGRALLSDFGVARSIEENTELTATGTAIGTPTYMSPEQIDGGHLDGRSDLYSLGMVGWEMLTGERPWAGESLYSVIYRQKHDPLPPIDAMRDDVPARLQYLIEGLMHKNPDRRWASAARFLAVLSNDAVLPGFKEWLAVTKKRRKSGVFRAQQPVPGTAPPFPLESTGGPTPPSNSTVRFRRGDTPPGGTVTSGGGFDGGTAAGVVNATDATQRVLASPWRDVAVIDADIAEHDRPRRRRVAIVAGAVAVLSVALIAASMLRRGVGEAAARPDSLRLTDAAGVEIPVVKPATVDSVSVGGTTVPTAADTAAALAAVNAAVHGDSAAAATNTPPRPGAPDADSLRRATAKAAAASPRVATDSGRRNPASTAPNAAARLPLAPTATLPAVPLVPAPGPALAFPAEHGAIAAGGRHSCMIDDAGHARCWGNNERGQLGDGGFETRTGPAPIVGDFAFAYITAGAWHTCGVSRDGDAFCWGSNDDGQLGDGTTSPRTAPVRVSGTSTFRVLRTGSAHTCGLTRSAAVACWGSNGHGQLGDGSRAVRTTPVTVSLGGLAAAVAVGFGHTCALTLDGTAWCWGQNDAGQVGDGTTTERSTPAQVATDKRFVSIAAGSTHTCAVTAAGEIYCWGRNNYGQLGIGATPASANTPQHVEASVAFVTVTAGSVHTCARSRDGRGWCWGRNSAGQLGDGSLADRARPVPVRGNALFGSLSANGAHTCGVTAAGDGFCWGYNVDGQLGEGDRENASIPSKVIGVNR